MVNAVILSTGDKILNIMKDMEISIPELSGMSGVRESVIMDILAGVKEGDITTLCKIADGLGVCVHELCPDEENYAVPAEKDTLAKLIVISEINGVDLNELIDSILNRGIVENEFYAQELVAALADMSEDDKLSVQAYLESKGAWTTEIANQDTKEFEEYHLDVRYFTDRDEIVDVSKVREQRAEENLSVMEKAEALIGALEANKTLFTQEERNLIVNYAYKTDDFDKTKALAQKLALMEDKGLAGAGAVMAEAQAEIDELPDPMIGLYEMHDYGYDWFEMLPLTKERALELWDDDYPMVDLSLRVVDKLKVMSDEEFAMLDIEAAE